MSMDYIFLANNENGEELKEIIQEDFEKDLSLKMTGSLLKNYLMEY